MEKRAPKCPYACMLHAYTKFKRSLPAAALGLHFSFAAMPRALKQLRDVPDLVEKYVAAFMSEDRLKTAGASVTMFSGSSFDSFRWASASFARTARACSARGLQRRKIWSSTWRPEGLLCKTCCLAGHLRRHVHHTPRTTIGEPPEPGHRQVLHGRFPHPYWGGSFSG